MCARPAELYGEVVPIEAGRIIEPADADSFELESRPLEVSYTEGHARHHLCLHDPARVEVFTGDSFGISYRELDSDKGPFAFPAATPVHFDPDAAHDAIERIFNPASPNASARPTTARLTTSTGSRAAARL